MLPTNPHYLLKAIIITGLLPLPLMAADSDGPLSICRPGSEIAETTPIEPISARKNAEIKADKARIQKDQSTRFDGNVRFEQLGRRILSDTLTYNKKQGTVTAQGNVSYMGQGGEKVISDRLEYEKASTTIRAPGEMEFTSRNKDQFRGQDLHYQTDPGTGTLSNGHYVLNSQPQAHGSAKRIDFKNKAITVLGEMSYTTCDIDNPAWVLKADSLELDQEKDVGIARNVTIRAKGVPIFYWPYLDFPLSGQRKSGFLAPRFGSSKLSGNYLGLPYYFNLAPNYDDTLTPQWFSKRGWQLKNEFRYLEQNFKGQLALEALPDDKVANEDRAAGNYDHQQVLSNQLRFSAHLDWVSDAEYREDFSDSLAKSSSTHTQQNISAEYSGKNWQLLARARNFEVIDNNVVLSEPVQLQSQLKLLSQHPVLGSGLKAGLEAELSQFGQDGGIRGSRLRINPSLSYPWRKDYAFAIPTVGGIFWRYDLSDAGSFDPESDSAVSYASLDTGLVFERYGKTMLQTLEPRAYYLKTGRENQGNLPLLDTEEPEFRFDRLFSPNRFVGGDRVGDAHQLAIGLTSRFLDKNSGLEYGRISLGGIRYFEDREVSLSTIPETRSESDLAAEWAVKVPEKWIVQHHLQWDPEKEKTRRGFAYLQYQFEKRTYIRLSYRAERNRERQADAALKWQISPAWRVLGSRRYDLLEEKAIETAAGIEHHSCCWALRLSGTERLTKSGEQERVWLLQFALKGLFDLPAMKFDPLSRKLLD